MSSVEYVAKIRTLAVEVATGRQERLENEGIVLHVPIGLDVEYDPVVSVAHSRVKSILVNGLYSQILCFDMCLYML